MKRLLLAALFAGTAFAASAQSVGVATQPTTSNDMRTDATRDVRDHTCLSHTGSLITTAKNRRATRAAIARHDATVDVACADFGRAYTRNDIENTGALTLGDALRRLDPAVH